MYGGARGYPPFPGLATHLVARLRRIEGPPAALPPRKAKGRICPGTLVTRCGGREPHVHARPGHTVYCWIGSERCGEAAERQEPGSSGQPRGDLPGSQTLPLVHDGGTIRTEAVPPASNHCKGASGIVARDCQRHGRAQRRQPGQLVPQPCARESYRCPPGRCCSHRLPQIGTRPVPGASFAEVLC